MNSFERGEIRQKSIDIVNENKSKSFDEISQLVAEAFGWEIAKARTHIRWLVREDFIEKSPEILAWPKRAKKIVVETIKPLKKVSSEKTEVKEAA